jgi:hypothetical protein
LDRFRPSAALSEADLARATTVDPGGPNLRRLASDFRFQRWLYWRRPGASWGPDPLNTPPQSLETVGPWELGTTSQAWFNDFTILVQTLTPGGSDLAQPKLMLSR